MIPKRALAGVVLLGSLLAPVAAVADDSCTIVGTDADDVLVGTDGRDVICGGAGDDVIAARGGDDVVHAGPGDDVVIAGNGDDRVWGGDGDDHLDGGSGGDVLGGGRGADTLLGENGSDVLWGDEGNDLLEGGRGSDEANGGAGRDVVRGGTTVGGTYVPTEQPDDLRGGPGVDLVIGTNAADVLRVGADGGRIEALGGADVLHRAPDGAPGEFVGGAGDDRVVGAPTDDGRPMPDLAGRVAAPDDIAPEATPAEPTRAEPADRGAGNTATPANNRTHRLPTDRTIDWGRAGRDRGIPNNRPSTNVVDHGATPDDGRDDTAAFKRAIENRRGRGGVIRIPSGRFHLSERLVLPTGVVLRGDGAASTTLAWTTSPDAAIRIGGDVDANSGWRSLPRTASRGVTEIRVRDSSRFRVGGFAEIEMDNQPEAAPGRGQWSQPPDPNNETWRLRTRGQLVRVTGKGNGTIRIADPLHLDFARGSAARIRPIALTEDAGVERLTVQLRRDGGGDGIQLRHSADAWIVDVEIANAGRAQIDIFVSLGCVLRNNHLRSDNQVGNGGQGYGINIQRHTTSCLMENNVIRGMRHAVLFQVGATGNVFAYNHTTNSRHPEADRADISFHGHEANHNLVEGNVVQQVAVSDWWGRVGPANTVFRNCIRPVRSGDTGNLEVAFDSDGQNIVGNVFASGRSRIIVRNGVERTVDHRNLIQGRRTQAGDTGSVLPNSLYRGSRPGFLPNRFWPVAASDDPRACTNSAAERGFRVANP